MTNYQGIDYGFGQTNIDHKTGLRYGVISMHAVPYWFEESEAEYGKPFCPHCFNEIDETSDFEVNGEPIIDKNGEEVIDEYYCSHCDIGVDGYREDIYSEEPLAFGYEQDGYRIYQGGNDTDLFVEESPYFTYAQFCSPCAPGAVHLESPLDNAYDNNKGYCLGHDWFEDGKAPYTVYSVETGEVVEPN
jgi:hypothetical protein